MGRVRPGSAAAALGLRAGDILLSADGEAVSGEGDIPKLSEIRETTVLRGGERLTLPAAGGE